MITKNEISALSLSPTKKDFVQIWNELLEVAGKLSERWDPTSTNESDPGIVLLKALTGIADRLNYNIDKNILEAFMPTAAQEDSMRKLCEMLGYNIKYYRSAQTSINIKYYNSDPSEEEAQAINKGVYIPKFTVITNSDKDINYFTTNATPLYISAETPSVLVDCMEGQIVKCESLNDNGVITINQISENNRFYLPETQIAENGIFIYNVFYDTLLTSNSANLVDGEPWTKVDNLNTQVRGTRVYKFGYDSYESRPYIEFPEDYSDLFNEGLFIYYTRTNGINGNVSAHTLTQIDKPNLENWNAIPVESFVVDNMFAANTGANIETIKQAYKNFKKTIGTFDTLVTCRDYMNKIYLMTNTQNNPLVSNILVTDIRNDLNRAITICSCDDSGIFYKEKALVESTSINTELLKPVFDEVTTTWHLGSATGIAFDAENFIVNDVDSFASGQNGKVWETEGKWVITQNDKDFITKLSSKTSTDKSMIDHFDLVFYPFKSYKQIKSNLKDISTEYNNSFQYSNDSFSTIKQELEQSKLKTVAHNFITPRYSTSPASGDGDIISINNYLRLNAVIATNTKITAEEGDALIKTIKMALANSFNMRELDFGEEIPFDSIIEVIENADSRIKVVSLNKPALYTTFSILEKLDNNVPQIVEYAVASDVLSLEEGQNLDIFKTKNSEGKTVSTFNKEAAKKIYNKLALRNILAGRVPLFKYNNTFKTNFSEAPYRVTITLEEDTNWTNLKKRLAANVKEYIKEKPSEDNPYVTYFDADNDILYTARYFNKKYTITETKVPKNIYKNSVISKDSSDNNITSIAPYCEIVTKNNKIADITLNSGEFIKFRAPNFKTIKTYPAYVNYHLALASEFAQEGQQGAAVAAEAATLYEILNSDRDSWSANNTNIKWQKVIEYFENIDRNNGLVNNKGYVKTFKIKQQISAYNSDDGNDSVQKDAIIVDIDDVTASEENINSLFTKSSCVKLINDFVGFDNDLKKNLFRAKLLWQPAHGETAPAGEGPDLNIDIALSNPFITSANTIATIQEAINDAINSQVNRFHEDGITPILPTECSWLVTFEFKCVPFDAASLAEWEKFIRFCNSSEAGSYSTILEGFKVIEDSNTIFWRKFEGNYNIGKAVLQSGEKLLKFDKNYFGLLPSDAYIKGIYLASNIGADAKPNIIANDEEYALGEGEYLYIEYTPSSTTAEGTTQELPPVQEVYGKGTIIRPKGFEYGLMDSDALIRSGTSIHKNVTFILPTGGTGVIGMHRFGANEQVEIRDYSQVTLNKNTFKSSPVINVYKNFNNCPELENKSNMIRSYTLKDGEYIFYSDQNKSEIAFFTSGTEVTVSGDFVLPQRDIIDIETILESGSTEIPWQEKVLSGNDGISFREFQYIKLGAGDTIKELNLTTSQIKETEESYQYLGKEWIPCTSASYILAGSEPNETIKLPAVNVGREGNGWEVCSVLEVDTSPDNSQTLRFTPNEIKTGVIVKGVSGEGEGVGLGIDISPTTSTDVLMFKTNLSCQSSNNNIINIKDVYNKDKLPGFQLKVFIKDQPEIVETLCGKPLPNYSASLDQWKGIPLTTKSTSDIWNQVGFDKIKVNSEGDYGKCDKALRLPINVIPDTYGIISFFVNYTSTDAVNAATTWIEFMPNMSNEDIKVLNRKNSWSADNKLYLEPGINCLRFNKSGHIFIKTSSVSQGILFFDDIKLVNCEKINYCDNEGTEHTEVTNGLNLDQIGYLKLDDTNNLIDNVVSTALEKSLCESFNKDLDRLADKAEQEITPITSYFSAADEIENFETDLTELSNKNSNLLETLKNTQSALNLEKDLLETLSNETLEEKLLILMSKFNPTDVTDQQLLEELDRIKTQIFINIKNSNIEAILASYRKTSFDIIGAEKSTPEESEAAKEILVNIINTTLQNLNLNFSMEASLIVNELEKVVSAENKTRVSALLDTLLTTGKEENIQLLINKLHNSIEISDIKTKIEELSDSAFVEDYELVHSIATQLKNILSSKDSIFLLEELSKLLENNSSISKDLLQELTDSLSIDSGDIDTHLDNIIEMSTSLLVMDGTVSQKQLIATIEGLQTLVIDFYEERVNNLIKSLNTEVSALNSIQSDSFKELITDLAAEDNAQIELLITKISDLANSYRSDRESLKELIAPNTEITWDDITSLNYYNIFTESAITIWSNVIINEINNSFNDFETILVSFIKNSLNFSSEEINTEIAALDGAYTEFSSSKHQAFLELSAVNSLVEAAETRCLAIHRNLSIIETAAQIKDTVGLSSHLNGDWIEDFNSLGVAKNGLVVNILTDLNSLTGQNTIEAQFKKAKLITQLKDEIKLVKQADSQILEILEQELYPNIIRIYNKFIGEPEVDENFVYQIAARLRKKLCELDENSGLEGLQTNLSKIAVLVNNLKNGIVSTSDLSLLLSTDEKALLENLNKIDKVINKVKTVKASELAKTSNISEKIELVTSWINEDYPEITYTDEFKTILSSFKVALEGIQNKTLYVEESSVNSLSVLALEQQLLADILELDKESDFYYSAPIENRLAIEFTGESSKNSLLNPVMNYDINNINNSFVISKLDIDYLDKGLQLARSSRLN